MSGRLEEILEFNQMFVEGQLYEAYTTSKYPNKKLVILTCMDTRLVELLPKAMNIKNGDVKMIKTAGALIKDPFDHAMSSILVALTALKAEEVMVVGHLNCGMEGLDGQTILSILKEKGVPENNIQTLENAGIDLEQWLSGCGQIERGVVQTVNIIKNHPLLPPGVLVHGLTIDPTNAKLELIYHDQK
jgi:carbonic anhydrase